MKIVFVRPPFLSEKKSFIHQPQIIPHLGIAYMTAILKREKYEVHIIDAIAERLSKPTLLNKITEIRPDVVGLTASTQQIYDAAEIAKDVKKISSEITTVIGGYHASALPEQTLKEFNSFDYLVYGEGELTLPELLKAIANNNSSTLRDIKGIAYRIVDKIVVNPPRPYLDVNSLPMPDFDGFNLALYKPAALDPNIHTFFRKHKYKELPVMTSRGCPYHCIFCFRLQGSNVRYRSIKSVVDEIKRDIEVYHVNLIAFLDETFTVNMKRTEALCDELIKSGLNKEVKWGCETRCNLVNEALLKKMKQAGCSYIGYGIESGEQKILDRATKGLKIEEIKNAVKWTKQAGIRVFANFIIGLPYDTVDSINKTIEFAMDIDPDVVTFAILTPFPGTDLIDMAKKGEGGLKIISYDWRDYQKQVGRTLELSQVNRKMLERLQRKGYIRFCIRPKRCINMLKIVGLRAIIAYLFQRIYIKF